MSVLLPRQAQAILENETQMTKEATSKYLQGSGHPNSSKGIGFSPLHINFKVSFNHLKVLVESLMALQTFYVVLLEDIKL